MEIPRNINIEHDFVNKPIKTTEVSGLVLATAVMLALLHHFLFSFFSCLSGCLLSLILSQRLNRLANDLPDFYKFAQAFKNFGSVLEIAN
jgi:hypothetical protein